MTTKTTPKPTAPDPMAVGQIKTLPVAEIGLSRAPTRQIRPLSEAGVTHLMEETNPAQWDAIIVRRWPADEPPPDGEGPFSWQVVAGYHRLTAAQRMGLKTIKADVRDTIATDGDFLLVALTSNLRHGEQMSQAEQITVLRRLREVEGMSLGDLSKHTGIPKGTITNWLSGRDTNAGRQLRYATRGRRGGAEDADELDPAAAVALPPPVSVSAQRMADIGTAMNKALNMSDLTGSVAEGEARAWWSAQTPSSWEVLGERVRQIAAWWQTLAAVVAAMAATVAQPVAEQQEQEEEGNRGTLEV